MLLYAFIYRQISACLRTYLSQIVTNRYLQNLLPQRLDITMTVYGVCHILEAMAEQPLPVVLSDSILFAQH